MRLAARDAGGNAIEYDTVIDCDQKWNIPKEDCGSALPVIKCAVHHTDKTVHSLTT